MVDVSRYVWLLSLKFSYYDIPSLVATPRCSRVANAGGRAFCHELDIGWVHIVQWIFSILAISAGLFWRKSVSSD